MELKQEWIEALRSKNYLQGQYRLRRTQGTKDLYCCLGVLADLVPQSSWLKLEDSIGSSWIWSWKSQIAYFEKTSLPQELLSLVGLTQDQMNALIALNDDRHFSFIQIADALEHNNMLELI